MRNHWLYSAAILCVISTARAEDFIPFPGVHVDDENVLRMRLDAKVEQQPLLKQDPQYCYISLPKLFAEARRRLSEGEQLDDEQRFLNGMVKLEYVFVDPESKDLTIAGKCEPIDKTIPLRPVGRLTGRPVIQLDDIVTALRCTAAGGKRDNYGCSLDFPIHGDRRLEWKARRLGPVKRDGFQKYLDLMLKIVGRQQVRYFGIDVESRSALVCIEADYILKQIAIGDRKVNVEAVRRHQEVLKPIKSIYNRWWFTPYYSRKLLVSADGNRFQIRGQSLIVHASNSQFSNSSGALVQKSTDEFAADVTHHFGELAKEISAFADLENICDLGFLASLIDHEALATRCQWADLPWVLNEYPLGRYRPVHEAESLGRFREVDCSLQIAIGGVEFSYLFLLDPRHRETDHSGRLNQLAAFPLANWRVEAPAQQFALPSK